MTAPAPLSPENPEHLQKIFEAMQLRWDFEEIDHDKDVSKFEVILAGLPCTSKSVVCDALAQTYGVKATQVTVLAKSEGPSLCDLDLRKLVKEGKPPIIFIDRPVQEIMHNFTSDGRKKRKSDDFIKNLHRTIEGLSAFRAKVKFKHVVKYDDKKPCKTAQKIMEILEVEKEAEPTQRTTPRLRRGAFLEAHMGGG